MDMSPEFLMLALTLVLAVVQILLAASVRTAELGLKWNAGARDGQTPPAGAVAGRLIRAQANLFETLPLFAGAVIMAEVAGKQGEITFIGAHLYFFGRLIYLPLYALGVAYVRSLAWMVSLAGLLMIIYALFV